MFEEPTPSESLESAAAPIPTGPLYEHPILDSEQSRTLHRHLRRKDNELKGKGPPLAEMYLGARIARLQTDNPEYLAQAAHSIRELIDTLPEKYDVPTVDYDALVPRVRDIASAWNDYEFAPLESKDRERELFYSAMRSFVEVNNSIRVTRREQAEKLTSTMDPAAVPLPTAISKLRVDEWRVYRAFFVAACHHGPVTAEEFDSMLVQFELFVIDRLGLRSFKTQDEIKDIVAEGEGNAQA